MRGTCITMALVHALSCRLVLRLLANNNSLGSCSLSSAPHLPKFKAMGLKIVPIIYNIGGASAMVRIHDGTEPRFIKAAVDTAVVQGYDGYNFDNELRGGASESSWKPILPYRGNWISFLNDFADALHAVNKTLSVDIAGCCGWVDTAHPVSPLGHCAGAFSAHEFVGASCADYASSKVDVVYGMSSYNAPINGPPWRIAGKGFNCTVDGSAFLKFFANHTQQALGNSKYGLGFKGGWPYYSNSSDPSTGMFDEKARSTLGYLRNSLGIQHASRWHNEPRSQQEWDAWGYFLHG